MLKINFERRDYYIISLSLIAVLLYCLPIVMLDRPYIDDLGRMLYGSSGWSANGRPLADAIMLFMSFGGVLLDISPLNQIISILMLLAVLFCYSRKNLNSLSPVAVSCCVFFFIASPFYIENLSYKFDSLPMSVSLAALIVPFCLNTRSNSTILISIILIVCSLSLYQASIGLFMILTVFEIVKKKARAGNGEVLLLLLQRAISLLLGFFLYKKFVSSRFVNGEYNITHSETLSLTRESLTIFKSNFENILWYFESFIASMPKLIWIAYSVISFVTIAKLIHSQVTDGIKKNLLAIIIVALSPILVFTFSFIHLLMLKQPVFSPRVLISFGGTMFFMAFLTFSSIKNKIVQSILALPMIWLCLCYSYSFSNSSSAQQMTDTLISSSIYSDVAHYNKEFELVNIIGRMPESKQSVLAQSKLPLLSRLIPVYLNYDWLWGAELLNHYGLNLKYNFIEGDRVSQLCGSKPFSSTKDYNLYDINNTLVIKFSNIKC
ncbi:glucosyltransferase domain-containing protein [Erwinia piriflorinigrans]|uniref:Putative 55,3 kDa protein in gtrB 5'region ORF485 n=1 Tax=Erwinia piriflorinigrans CFBP 5888 TaxID=1161919 RepID=V5Z956_9GAMM|nr:glucosyltransferase domain-containing protein [Erwinia piriflorinigrans]CCG87779.1 putative 55,3 kDa protein in gtrB 5'region ORF485 [Erwinia piriflorinigrans CFBP 5888]